MAGLSTDELKALVQSEMRQSLGFNSSKLATARQKSMYYYLGLPVGDLTPPEIDGRSSVVSTDVRDTIESMLPQLMVTFTGSDTVAEFEAQGPDDEQKAGQATEYVNYLFFKKNNGHRIAYNWMKDALLQKNGIVKVWWDTRNEETKEEYKALSDVELAQIMDDEEVEVISQNTYPDEEDAEQRQEALKHMLQAYQQAMQAGNQQAAQQVQAQAQELQAKPVAMLFDIVCKRVKTAGKIQIDNVPPEEFLISRNAKDIQTARFCGHRVQRTVSELKSMGYKNVDQLSGDDQSQGLNMERIQRLSWNDENAYLSNEITTDEAQKTVWVTEAYIRADFDGDGIVELRKVTIAGNELLDNEEVDYTPFVSITPIPLPHTFFGLSIADLAMESQKTKTSILRSQLDNMYLNVNGRYFAVEGQVNLDDLLTSRPGGVVRIKQPGSVGRLDQGIGNSGESYQLMEYMQQDLENRTGWSRQSQGNDASGIHTTATAANIVTNKSDMRVDMISRNFAEGFTELFRLMLKLVCQHQDKEEMVKLSGGWTGIDPREWRNQFDVTINVGIGLGNKDQRVQHLITLGMAQEKGLQIGVVTPENIYHSSTELAKLLGFKNGDKFFSDPTKQPPKPPPPDPEVTKINGQMQIEQMKAQLAQQDKEREMQRDIELARQQQEFQAQQDTLAKQLEMQAKENQAILDAQEAERKRAFDEWKTRLENETKVAIAQLQAQTSLKQTAATINAGKESEGLTDVSEDGSEQPTSALTGLIEAVNTNMAQLINNHAEGHAQMMQVLTKPKQVIRDANGRVAGVQ